MNYRIFTLDGGHGQKSIHFLADAVSVDSDRRQTVVNIIRTGTFHDPRYGQFEISRTMLQDMISNFNAGVYGQDIMLDVAHAPENGAAATVKELFLDGDKLRAKVEWTEMGIEAVTRKGYKYLSAEFTENFIDNEDRKEHGCVLLGAGLTIRPVIKKLDPVQLSEDSLHDVPTYISKQLIKKLSGDDKMKWEKLLSSLMAQLVGITALQEESRNKIYSLAEQTVEKLEDESTVKTILAQFHDAAKELAETKQENVSINLSTVGGMSRDDVVKLLAELEKDHDEKAQQAQANLTAKRKIFSDAVDADEGLTDEAKKSLCEKNLELISADMTDDKIKQFAELQITTANEVIAAKKLADMGGEMLGGTGGSVRLTEDTKSMAKKLEGQQHDKLKLTDAYLNGQIRLSENVAPFVTKVLSVFDAQNAQGIHNAVKTLAGETNISDTDLPIGFRREVIREALSDLRILDLVSTYVDAAATATTQIPYEERNTGAALINDARVAERGSIPKVNVQQKMDLAYITAMKLAIDVSNEVMHFTRASAINWDAWGRNVASASRVLREILCSRLANEMQRASDSFQAVAVADESIASQLDGSSATMKTALFPIVRPRTVYDLQGNAIGSTENPITIAFGATPVLPYDGTGEQSAGTYYIVSNYNLGYINWVDESGDPATPDEETATISYSRATNILKVDSDVPEGTRYEVHLNKLIQAVGARKAMMSSSRYITPDFLLMSETLNDTCTNAEQYTQAGKRKDSDVTAMGDLADVKGLPAWSTNAPRVDLGDERILLGQRANTSYTVAKPWTMKPPVESRDSNGQLNGGQETYGEEYNSIHTPTPIKGRFTSVLFYSVGNR